MEERVYTSKDVHIENGVCIIPNWYTSIGKYAFNGCDSLKRVHISDSVTRIGYHAFHWCRSLTSIHIPDSVTSIGDGAFDWCESLASIHIPDGVTSIGNNAFRRCRSLTSVHIPDSVTSIGNNAFDWCRSLTSITYHGTHAVRCIDGYCMEIVNSHSVGEYTVHRAKFLGTAEKYCFIAEKDRFYAHGVTVKDAVKDLEFKLCKERGIEQYRDYTLDSLADYIFYRVMTGAYQMGTEAFMRAHGIDPTDKYTIRQVIELTKGEYGHERLMQNLKKLGILEESV